MIKTTLKFMLGVCAIVALASASSAQASDTDDYRGHKTHVVVNPGGWGNEDNGTLSTEDQNYASMSKESQDAAISPTGSTSYGPAGDPLTTPGVVYETVGNPSRTPGTIYGPAGNPLTTTAQ
jgi:hypothetical protein